MEHHAIAKSEAAKKGQLPSKAHLAQGAINVSLAIGGVRFAVGVHACDINK
jgi:hypothetical protein